MPARSRIVREASLEVARRRDVVVTPRVQQLAHHRDAIAAGSGQPVERRPQRSALTSRRRQRFSRALSARSGYVLPHSWSTTTSGRTIGIPSSTVMWQSWSPASSCRVARLDRLPVFPTARARGPASRRWPGAPHKRQPVVSQAAASEPASRIAARTSWRSVTGTAGHTKHAGRELVQSARAARRCAAPTSSGLPHGPRRPAPDRVVALRRRATARIGSMRRLCQNSMTYMEKPPIHGFSPRFRSLQRAEDRGGNHVVRGVRGRSRRGPGGPRTRRPRRPGRSSCGR